MDQQKVIIRDAKWELETMQTEDTTLQNNLRSTWTRLDRCLHQFEKLSV